MVQNILIDIWITSQTGVWGVCPPTNRKNTTFAWNLDTQKNSRLAQPPDYYFFYSNLKSWIRPCILKTYCWEIQCMRKPWKIESKNHGHLLAGRYVYKWDFIFCCFVGSLSRGHLFSISVFPLFWQNSIFDKPKTAELWKIMISTNQVHF